MRGKKEDKKRDKYFFHIPSFQNDYKELEINFPILEFKKGFYRGMAKDLTGP
jgi:hypothetical protein